ncbi:MAG: hypothetical protein JNK11_15345 [Alphaproteobacteria bacterium]|nr:hypothetical protein [Alphaproteobacteria bacterium]
MFTPIAPRPYCDENSVVAELIGASVTRVVPCLIASAALGVAVAADVVPDDVPLGELPLEPPPPPPPIATAPPAAAATPSPIPTAQAVLNPPEDAAVAPPVAALPPDDAGAGARACAALGGGGAALGAGIEN